MKKLVTKETMQMNEVVNYLIAKGLRQTAFKILSESNEPSICNSNGDMDTKFIRDCLTLNGDDILFRQMECAVTTRVFTKVSEVN